MGWGSSAAGNFDPGRDSQALWPQIDAGSPARAKRMKLAERPERPAGTRENRGPAPQLDVMGIEILFVPAAWPHISWAPLPCPIRVNPCSRTRQRLDRSSCSPSVPVQITGTSSFNDFVSNSLVRDVILEDQFEGNVGRDLPKLLERLGLDMQTDDIALRTEHPSILVPDGLHGPCVREEWCTVIRSPRRGDSDRSLRHGH